MGKFAGAAGAAKLTGEPLRESMTLGILLNTRGLTELIILNVGLGLGVLDTRLFSVMVAMAVITTLMAGPLLQRIQHGHGKSPDIGLPRRSGPIVPRRRHSSTR